MRSFFSIVLALAIAASAAAQLPCQADNDGGNYNDLVIMGGSWIGVKFTAAGNFDVSRIEVFTGEGIGKNGVGIWSHDALLNQPGTDLGSGSFAMASVNSWQGADLSASVTLTAGTTYWMVWICQGGTQASVDVPMATLGQPYRGSFDGGGSWSGPFQFNDRHWKFRLIGNCIPCAGFFQAYGAGCSGTSGVPTLAGQGCPSPGESISIAIASGAPGATGILFLGAGTGSAPVTPGCMLQNLPLLAPFLPVTLSAGGSAFLPATLPFGLPSVDVNMQFLIGDGGAPFGVASSNPLNMHIQ